MNLHDKPDNQLLALYQQTRSDRKRLMDLESEIRREMNSRHGLQDVDRYPFRKGLSPEKVKKLSKVVNDTKVLGEILKIIEK